MIQRIRLSSALSSAKDGDPPDDGDFYRFFFGFTGAAGDEALDAMISNFELSFIRPGDAEIDCENDSARWPWEDAEPESRFNCTPGL